MSNNQGARIIQHTGFNSKGFTDENYLGQALLTKNDTINPVVTHVMGKDSDKFPLSFLSEGQVGGTLGIPLNSIEYDWPIIGRLRKGDLIVSHQYVAGDKPGLNNQPFYVVMTSNWLIEQYIVRTPNGIQLRVEKKEPVGNNYKYTFRLASGGATAYVPLTEIQAGLKLVMFGAAPVSSAFSKGNSSNTASPGKMKNQISILRKSYTLAGNISNKYVEFQFPVNGKTTNLWIEWERYQHMMNWRQEREEHLWYSQYNRLADGTIPLKDPDTGREIPIGAGVDDQIPNRDTYATLTAQKIKNTVGDVLYGATDTGNMNVVLYTGMGGLDEFDTAIKTHLTGWTVVNAETFIKNQGSRSMVYGGFFTAYEHVDGHTIVVKPLRMLDYGSVAENSPLHPVSGKPISSYDMYFVDQSQYDGQKNVVMVHEKGRSMVTGILKGMAATPFDFEGNSMRDIATDQDVSSIHFLSTAGVCIRRNTHCFKLSCSLS